MGFSRIFCLYFGHTMSSDHPVVPGKVWTYIFRYVITRGHDIYFFYKNNRQFFLPQPCKVHRGRYYQENQVKKLYAPEKFQATCPYKIKCFKVKKMFNFNTEITFFVFSLYWTCAMFLFHPLFFGQNKRMLFAAAHVQKNVPHDYNTNGNNRFFYVIFIFTMEFFSKTWIHKNLCTCRFFSQCFTAKKIQLLLL